MNEVNQDINGGMNSSVPTDAVAPVEPVIEPVQEVSVAQEAPAEPMIQSEPEISVESVAPVEPMVQSVPEIQVNQDVPVEPVFQSAQEVAVEQVTTAEPEVQTQPVADNTQMASPATGNVGSNEKKPKKGLIIGLIIVGVLIVLGLVLNFLVLTPERLVKTNIGSSFEVMKLSVKNYYKNVAKFDFDKESVGFTGDVTLNSDYKKDGLDLSKLKNYTLNYDIVIDKPNNKISAGYDIKRLNKDFMNTKSYYNGKYTISDYGDMFNRTVKSESGLDLKSLSLTAAKEEDVITLLDRLKVFAVGHVSKDKVTKETGKYEVNGKKSSLTRLNYTLNDDYEKDLKEFIKGDEKALQALVNITGESKEEILKGFENDSSDAFNGIASNSIVAKDTVPPKSETKSTSSFNFYYKVLPIKSKFIEVVDGDDSFVFEPLKDRVNLTKYTKNKKELDSYYDSKNSKLYVDYTGEDKSSMKVDMIVNEEKINGTITYTSDKDTYNIKVDSKTAYSDNKDSKTDASIDIEVKGEYNFNLNIHSNMGMTHNAKVNELKEKNTITETEFTSNGYEIYSTKLQQKLMILLNDIAPELLKQLQGSM